MIFHLSITIITIFNTVCWSVGLGDQNEDISRVVFQVSAWSFQSFIVNSFPVSFEEPKPALDVACLDSFNSVNNIEYTGLNRNINRGVTGRSHGCGNANSGVCDDNSDIGEFVYVSLLCAFFSILFITFLFYKITLFIVSFSM